MRAWSITRLGLQATGVAFAGLIALIGRRGTVNHGPTPTHGRLWLGIEGRRAPRSLGDRGSEIGPLVVEITFLVACLASSLFTRYRRFIAPLGIAPRGARNGGPKVGRDGLSCNPWLRSVGLAFTACEVSAGPSTRR